MIIKFAELLPKSKRVHIRMVSFELVKNFEYRGEVHELVVTAKFTTSGNDAYDETSWGRVEDDVHSDNYFRETSGAFLRDSYRDKDVIWTDPIYYELSSKNYYCPIFYNERIRKSKPTYNRNNFDLLIDTIRPMSLGTDNYSMIQVFNCMAWPTIMAFSIKLKSNPAFRIVMGRNKADVGPWVFSKEKKDIFSDESVILEQLEAYELKRWIHGCKSIYDKPKEIMKKAARRRIIKHRVTTNDITFFQTIFGASQVGRWMKEAQNKNKHEHTCN